MQICFRRQIDKTGLLMEVENDLRYAVVHCIDNRCACIHVLLLILLLINPTVGMISSNVWKKKSLNF